jgi:hypothetical protein
MNKEGCPICGYEKITVLDESGCTTFEICDSCGCEAGYEYDPSSSNEHLEKHRRKWVVNKNCKWWSTTTKPPIGWNPIEQMKKAGIKVPS